MASDEGKKITLKSSDGEEFVVDEAVAMLSQTIRHMIEDDCAESGIPLPNVNSKILAKVIEYCKKHVECTPAASSAGEDKAIDEELKGWDSDFVKVDQATLFDLILFDQDYYPGRRKRGKDYKDDMLELPYIYPGQICRGKVTTLHLYQGAFVDIGCVHDGKKWTRNVGQWQILKHYRTGLVSKLRKLHALLVHLFSRKKWTRNVGQWQILKHYRTGLASKLRKLHALLVQLFSRFRFRPRVLEQ